MPNTNIQTQINRIVQYRDLSFNAVAAKGVVVPSGSTINDLPTLIGSIQSGGTMQSKTVDPSTSQIVVEPDTGYDGLSSVTVNAVELQSKTVTPSSSTQVITPDNTLIKKIPAGSSSATASQYYAYLNDCPSSYGDVIIDEQIYIDGQITVSDGTVIDIHGTTEPGSNSRTITSITTCTGGNSAAFSAASWIGGTLYFEFQNSSFASGVTAEVTRDFVFEYYPIHHYTGLSSVTVDAVVPTSSSYTLLGSHEFTVNTTSTSAASVGTFKVPTTVWTKDKAIYIRIRDKAGKRAGYFYGTDNWFINLYAQTGSTSAFSAGLRYIRRYSTSSVFGQYYSSSTTGYGVYAYSVDNNGTITVYSRYNSSYSLTVNGTYVVEVYLLDMPGGISPFA